MRLKPACVGSSPVHYFCFNGGYSSETERPVVIRKDEILKFSSHPKFINKTGAR